MTRTTLVLIVMVPMWRNLNMPGICMSNTRVGTLLVSHIFFVPIPIVPSVSPCMIQGATAPKAGRVTLHVFQSANVRQSDTVRSTEA